MNLTAHYLLRAIFLSGRILRQNVGLTANEAKRFTHNERITIRVAGDNIFYLLLMADNRECYIMKFAEVSGIMECVAVQHQYTVSNVRILDEISCRRCQGKSGKLPIAQYRRTCETCVKPVKTIIDHEVML